MSQNSPGTASYDHHKRDAILARDDDTIVTLTADLQQVQYTPNLQNSSAFYLRKLSNYNFGVHDEGSKDAHMYLWDETVGSRGCNEIASCLLHYITTKYQPLVHGQARQLILWNDRCCGQNNNRMVLLLLIWLARHRYFSQVHHKFFLTGHSYNNCDRDFGLLEKEAKKRTTLVPSDLEQIVRDARTDNPFTPVRMTQDSFKDFKALLDVLRFPTNFRVTHYHRYSYSMDLPEGILAYPDYGDVVSYHIQF